MLSPLTIVSPLSGNIWPLERIPDPVFAQKIVGDGLSIDPTDGLLLATCDGEVVSVHPAGHAVTLRTPQGLEILMHVGIDTVTLHGEGFHPRSKPGDKVRTGTPLIEFDLDFLATHAKSLLTQIVLTQTERITSWDRSTGHVRAGKDTLFTVTFAKEEPASGANGAKTFTSRAVLIPNKHGLHARPSAVLANLAKTFTSTSIIQCGEKHANARSVTAIMALEAGCGDKVQILTSGADAKAAGEQLAELLAQGCGDDECAPPSTRTTAPAARAAAPAIPQQSSDPNILLGASASPGIAVGEIFQVRRVHFPIVEAGAGVDLERRKLASALETAQGQLAALCAQFQTKSQSEKGAIFAAHQELASDPELLDLAESAIAKNKSAAFAWNKAVATLADRLASLRNELLAQRANDLRDVGFRILALLTEESIQRQYYPSNSILVAEDFAPSDVADFDRSRVLAFCTTRGGATSHVAILARSLGIPVLAGIHPAALDVPDGTVAILNACKGTLQLRPSPQEIEYLRSNQEHTQRHRENDLLTARSPAVTLDGMHIEVLANICGLKDATVLNASGGDGVGLLRSEFIFMNSAVAPTEDQQFESYKTIVQLIGPDRSIIIRTLDIGGDKPLSYLPIPKEDNPFLGERGVRVCLGHPDILRCQLRAILRAASFGKVSVMFPMITTLSELREVKMMLAQEAAALGVPNIPAGIMVEVPAAAVMAAHFAKESAFFSIGTNDLTQYTLATDRGHTKLAAQVDSLNPAVLRLIAHTVTGARTKNRPVGICGGIASDPHAVPILLGLGVNELSVSLPSIPTIKAQIRTLRIDSCRELAERALAAESPEEVRALAPDFGFAPFPNPTK